ncbi:MAG TPA: carboxymuconolactone decarboxylase family protein [Thermoanaerobaculia bacterium]|nr:carboxymuconolactone decarboxylase family protein [Thermoanaerobaculia bacterium]
MSVAPRIQPLPESQWDPEITAVFSRENRAAPGDGRVLNIFRTLAHHPKLLKRWTVFGNHVLFKSTLPPRERELVILRIGWLCRSEYEWGQHVRIGREAGLTDEEIRRIPIGPDAKDWSPSDADLLRAADELHHDSRISDATWERLAARYDRQQMLDLVFAVGQYTLVSMVLNSCGVELDPGVEGFPVGAAGSR